MISIKFNEIARKTTDAFGSSWAFTGAILLILLWACGGIIWYGFGLMSQSIINSICTLTTFVAVFCIQNTQNRESRAINVKLDELILSKSQANNSIINAESLPDAELDRLHKYYLTIAEAHRKRHST